MSAKNEKKREEIVLLRKSGLSFEQIAQQMGYKYPNFVRAVCQENGLDMTLGQKHEAMRKYKAEGHTAAEVAERFGMAEHTAQTVCKGIAPQPANREKQKETLRKRFEENKDEYARKIVDERTPWFEYIGGYTGSDGYMDVRCKTCGSVIHKSSVCIRQRKARCGNCLKESMKPFYEEQKEKWAKYRADKKAKQEAEKAWKKHLKDANRQAEQLSFSFCAVCGQPFFAKQKTNKYCSTECSNRVHNARHEANRRLKIQDAMIDSNITLAGLFRRDNGFCYICGGKCDYTDFVETDKGIVCGDAYPSIDHVMPLALGGKHAWENVRLAHRRCNLLKRDTPPVNF